jgi:quinol monooxygenase YgiN
MIHATVTLAIAPEQRQGALDVLRSLMSPTRVEPGCLDCRLYEDVTAEGVFTLVEDWATLADLKRHLRTEAYRLLLMVMELSAAPPEVRFHMVSRTMGMEAIHAARGQ